MKLTSLLVEFPRVPRWVFKLDNEFDSRGLAYLDVHSIPELSSMVEIILASPDEQARADTQKELFGFVTHRVPDAVVVVTRRAYRTWSHFVAAMAQVGAVIEASPVEKVGSPSVGLLVEPDGTVAIKSVVMQLPDPECDLRVPCSMVGGSWPVPFAAIKQAAAAIGNKCFEKKLYGYMSVDFLAFMDRVFVFC